MTKRELSIIKALNVLRNEYAVDVYERLENRLLKDLKPEDSEYDKGWNEAIHAAFYRLRQVIKDLDETI